MGIDRFFPSGGRREATGGGIILGPARAILSEDTTAEIFDGKGREAFLDGLAFR